MQNLVRYYFKIPCGQSLSCHPPAASSFCEAQPSLPFKHFLHCFPICISGHFHAWLHHAVEGLGSSQEGPFPLPIRITREHRENLATVAKQLTHKAKESLRKVRTAAMNQTKKAKSSTSEDTIRLIEKQVLRDWRLQAGADHKAGLSRSGRGAPRRTRKGGISHQRSPCLWTAVSSFGGRPFIFLTMMDVPTFEQCGGLEGKLSPANREVCEFDPR